MVELFYKRLGEVISSARKKQGFSGESLGARLNLSRASISNIERGHQKLSLDQALILFRELGIPYSEVQTVLMQCAFEQELQNQHPDVKSVYRKTISAISSEVINENY